jgi:transposase InsO family protein
VKYAFIQSDLTPTYRVSDCCDALEVSRSGYYAWRRRPISARQERRAKLADEIRAAHAEHRGVYGSPRVHRVLADRGEQACENTVAKIMKEEEIAAKKKRKFTPRTTDSQHAKPVADNVLDRQFAAGIPGADCKWVTDITYVPTDEGWLYLAAVLDLHSRRIVGWSTADHLRTELVSEALGKAIRSRRPPEGLLVHSDRGVQYASDEYQRLLAEHGIVCSMSRSGDCWDNAVMESFWATLKTELIHHERYATREQARLSIFQYIEGFYNRRRLHSALGYRSPEAFEAKAS